MLEVLKPVDERPVEIHKDALQRVPVRTTRFRTNRHLQFLNAFLARPVFVTPKFESRKCETFRAGVDDSCLRGVKRQRIVRNPVPHEFQSRFGVDRRATQDHEIVGVANHRKPGLSHEVVQGARSVLLSRGLKAAPCGAPDMRVYKELRS